MAKPVRHGAGWRVRWIDAHGVRRRKTFKDHDDALVFQIKAEAEAAEVRHGWKTGRPLDQTFAELCDLYIETQLATTRPPQDIASSIGRHLCPVFGDLQLRDISSADIDRFGASRLKRFLPKIVRNQLTLLEALLIYAVECGWLDRAPRVRKPKIQCDRFKYLEDRRRDRPVPRRGPVRG